jgi:uncharacterized protein YoxC
MDTAAYILVIIVSATLTVFLIALTVLIVALIKLIKKVKELTDKAENAVDGLSQAGAMLKNASGPLAVARVAVKLFKKYKK